MAFMRGASPHAFMRECVLLFWLCVPKAHTPSSFPSSIFSIRFSLLRLSLVV